MSLSLLIAGTRHVSFQGALLLSSLMGKNKFLTKRIKEKTKMKISDILEQMG